MQIQSINGQHNQSFGHNVKEPFTYRLSKEAIKAAEESTGLTYEEMTRLPFSETRKLMIERGTLKEPSKIKLWISKKYKEIGEKLGLLQKHYNIYTDID